MKYGIIPVICFLFFFFICMGEIQFWWFWLLVCVVVPILVVELAELLFPKKMKKYWDNRLKEAQEKWKKTPSKYK